MTDKNVIGDTAPEEDIPEDNAKAADGSGWKQWSLIKRFRFVWNGKFIMSGADEWRHAGWRRRSWIIMKATVYLAFLYFTIGAIVDAVAAMLLSLWMLLARSHGPCGSARSVVSWNCSAPAYG